MISNGSGDGAPGLRGDFSMLSVSESPGDWDGGAAPVLLRAVGEVDVLTAPVLDSALQAALQHSDDVVLDLAGVSFLDAYGLRALLSAHGSAPRLGGRFRLRALPPRVRRLLALSQLDDVLMVQPGNGSVPHLLEPQPGVAPRSPVGGALVDAFAQLAGTPDDSPDVQPTLLTITQLVADLVAPVTYSSVTVLREEAFTTVAVSNELAMAVDEAQYADEAGPCLEALTGNRLVTVPEIGGLIVWPDFRAEALRLGLSASVSIPLFAGSGGPLAALNLYGRDALGMTALSEAVRAAYDQGPGDRHHAAPERPDRGIEQLASGVAAALAVRDVIQQAVGLRIGRDGVLAEEAYSSLRLQAARTGRTLLDTAVAVCQQAG